MKRGKGVSGEAQQIAVSSCVTLKMDNVIAGCVLSTRALLPLDLQQAGRGGTSGGLLWGGK